jgi:hypothetical protein
LGREGYWIVRLLGVGDGAFDGYMIYFSVIVSALSLGVKIGVGASDDFKDCIMIWERLHFVARALGFLAEVAAVG